MDATIFRYGHMARLLSEICPGRTLAVLEGGYFKTNYVEAASMMVRGLKVRLKSTSKTYKKKKLGPSITTFACIEES